MFRLKWGAAALVLACGLSPVPGFAQQELITEKKVFELPQYTTVNGATIKGVRIGWESYGTLNQDKSNAILVTHFFSGTSHAAGKYTAGDKAPGYWDAIIGPGKAIDTNKYFVLSSDTLVNLNTGVPNVVTTGPATVNPDTGKPYGMAFPVVSIRDFVNVQKALVDSLGITRLKAVAGPSMGALQAYEWAASYPEMVEKIIPVIGTVDADAFLVGWLDIWAQPIRLDPKWNGGDYYGKDAPVEGLKAALKIVSLHANAPAWADKTFGRATAVEGKDPGASFANHFKIETALDQGAAGRASASDANHFLYLVKANQLAAADVKKIKAPALVIYTPSDLIFPPAAIERTVAGLKANATNVETATLEGPNGHLNGVIAMAQVADRIAAFLAK